MQKIQSLAIRAFVVGLSMMTLAGCIIERGHWR